MGIITKEYITLKVEVIDEDICSCCKKFKFFDSIVKRKDAYGFEVEERVMKCANQELCEHLLEHITAQGFLHK